MFDGKNNKNSSKHNQLFLDFFILKNTELIKEFETFV